MQEAKSGGRELLLLVVQFILLVLTLASIGYYCACLWAASDFFKKPLPADSGDLNPFSILIPLCGADHEASSNYSSFCLQDYPTFQLIFGVRDQQDSAVPVVEQLIRDFPAVDISLVVEPHSIGHNLKVGNLHNMLRVAKYEQIIIVDSDIRVGPGYLRQINAEMQQPNVGMVTCLYRAGHASSLSSKLEAIGITAGFHPGVLLARKLEGVRFALGATMAATRSDLDRIGGFAAIADYLGDDFMLGYLMAQSGKEVLLSRCIVETAAEAGGLFDMLRHQVRWARGTRVCRPAGYWGLIFTHGTVMAFFLWLLSAFSWWSGELLVLTLSVRLLMAWKVGVRCINDTVLRRNFWLLPLRDLFSFLIWFLSLQGRIVEWRGTRFRLVEDGKIVEIRD